jgi:hypothetical protein
MDIIKHRLRNNSNDLPNSLICTIARMMFNHEMNKKIYTRDGKIDKPKEDNNVITHEGVSYSISHAIGELIYLIPNGIILNKAKIRNDLENELKVIYERYEAKHPVMIYNRFSSVFTQIETKTPSELITRYIGNTHKTVERSNVNRYMFKWYDDRTCACSNGNTCTPISHTRYYVNDFIINSNISLYTNSIIIDLNDIFKTENKIYSSPVTEDFTMSQFIITTKKITYEVNRTCHVETMIRSLYGNDKNYERSTMHNIFNIYEEKWDNIKPLRILKASESLNRIAFIFNRVINIEASFEEEEMEEKRDRKTGAKERPNDRCHICYMLLYDTIYVLEFVNTNTKHVCVCTLCLHIHYLEVKRYLEPYIKKSNTVYSILKVDYPRTCYDLINEAKISPQYKELLCHLARISVLNVNNIMVTPRYIGVRDIHDILYKNINMYYEDKMFFLY